MKKKVSIHIGELYASKKPVVIRTLLGSCVAVCLFDPIKGIGGMNHILLSGNGDLPRQGASTAGAKPLSGSTRYGINAMELLINMIMNLGGNRNRLVAKAFGGGHILAGISEKNGPGQKNVRFVLEFLRIEKINIISQNLGGYHSRRIYFHTDTGDVFLKRIASVHLARIAAEEQKHLRRIEKEAKKPADVTFF